MSKPAAEEDWEYCSEDGEDYEWEYSEEEAEPEAATPATEDKPEEKSTNGVEKSAIEVNNKSTNGVEKSATEVNNKSTNGVEKSATEVNNKSANDTKKLAEKVEEAEEESEYEDEDEEEEEEKEDEDLEDLEDLEELEDIDLPDPFSTEPVPKVRMNGSDQNGDSDKKDKKNKKHKSRHHDKFEKFRRLEDGESRTNDDHKTKKIHVRSKDPSKIAKKFERAERDKDKDRGRPKKLSVNGKEAPKPKPIEINKLCKICGKEPYLVERLVAEKSWWHKNCFRCQTCQKILNLDTYASHQGVIYCKPHHRELFQPKRVDMDLTQEIINKNLDFSTEDPIERHRRQERKMETIVRESKPVKLQGVVKSQVDDSKWEGLDELDVGSKFLMFEKGNSEDREPRHSSDRYGIMEKLKRLQAGEDVEELLAEIDEEMPSNDEEGSEIEDDDTAGLTNVQKKAHNAEKLFTEDSRKEKLALQRKKELNMLRDKLMAGTRDSVLDSFDELNRKKVKKTQVDVRSENAKKFMELFNKGEIPEHISASDRITLEKEAELEAMRSKKREERDYFKKMENGELDQKEEYRPKLLVGKLKDVGEGEGEGENGLPSDDAPLAKKFSFFENYSDKTSDSKDGKEVTSDRLHAARECKARSVLNKFKDMEQKIANGEEVDDPLLMHKRPIRKFTPPRRLGTDSESEYSDSEEYSSSEYTDSDDCSSDSEEDEYLKNIREAARAKELRAKFEEWEASVGEDGGYTNLVDENGQPLETASKLKNRFERLAMEEEEETKASRPKFQVRRFK